MELAPSNALGRVCLAALPFVVFLYALATLTSMAGMELFGLLAQLLALLYLLSDPRAIPASFARFWTKADAALFLLFAIVLVGLWVTPPIGGERFEAIGAARWMILFYFTRVAVSASWSRAAQPALAILIFAAGLIAAYGILQYFTGMDLLHGAKRTLEPSFTAPNGAVFYRADGLFASTTTFAHSMAMTACFAFAFALLAVWKRRRLDGAAAICALLCGLAVVASLTRGAWLALAIALLTMSAFAGGKRFVIALVSVPALLAALWLWVPGVGARAATMVDAHFPSNVERLNLWRANWEMFKDHPLVGVGYGMNEAYSVGYLERIGEAGSAVGNAHNNYLQFLSGTGALGFLCYAFFSLYFLGITVHAWFLIPRDRLWERATVLGALGAQVALHVGGMTECNFNDALVNHQYLLILAMAWAVQQSYVQEHGSLIKRPRNEPALGGI